MSDIFFWLEGFAKRLLRCLIIITVKEKVQEALAQKMNRDIIHSGCVLKAEKVIQPQLSGETDFVAKSKGNDGQ